MMVQYHMTDHGSSLQISMVVIIMGIWGGLVYIYYHLLSSIIIYYHLLSSIIYHLASIIVIIYGSWIHVSIISLSFFYHFSIFPHLSMDFFQEEMWHVLRRLQMPPAGPSGAESPRELVMAEMPLGPCEAMAETSDGWWQLLLRWAMVS